MSDIVHEPFEAYRIHRDAGRVEGRLERIGLTDLSEGEVLIRVSHSSINYKDVLAATGAGAILRRFPLVGGIDLAGTVAGSAVREYREGDVVLVSGCGLSETRDGGFARYARVPAEAVVPLPAGLTAEESMAIGTAGLAAARAISLMQRNGQTPSLGPVVVSGASGGVGSLAIDMLASLGYEVWALTGKLDSGEYLRHIGAAAVLPREAPGPIRPLESARFGGAIDNLGGDTLAWLLAGTREHGNVASVGLAAGAQLSTSVMPFILRGVCLLGVNSANLPPAPRLELWRRLGSDLKPRHLARIVRRRVTLAELPSLFPAYLAGGIVGRTLVRVDERR